MAPSSVRRKDSRSKFDEIVVPSGAERFMDTPAKYFSSGMYVRLVFAVARHLEPEIYRYGVGSRTAIFQKNALVNVRTDGRTILFVSHNLALSESCTHAIKQDGKLRQSKMSNQP